MLEVQASSKRKRPKTKSGQRRGRSVVKARSLHKVAALKAGAKAPPVEAGVCAKLLARPRSCKERAKVTPVTSVPKTPEGLLAVLQTMMRMELLTLRPAQVA
jgi:hypothetical protein